MMQLTQFGLVAQGSHIVPLVKAGMEEEAEAVQPEEEVEDHQEPQQEEIQKIRVMAPS